MDEELERPADQARSFGGVADAYERGRPTYPLDAVRWLTGGAEPLTVLELGAGTGKLTARLVELGHDVHATDPDEKMLAHLERLVPQAGHTVAAAEEIPLGDNSVDLVVVAQAFHWFDHERALAEIARVLTPRGHLALVWNERDDRIPWVRRLWTLLGGEQNRDDLEMPLVMSERFGFVEEETFKHWQDVNRESIVDLVSSRSYIAVLDEEERAAKLADVLALYDDYGRGMDGMQLPYVVKCYRAQVVKSPDVTLIGEAKADEGSDELRIDDTGPVSDGTDTDSLLIDFR